MGGVRLVNNNVLVAEISGKRAGTKKERPTEKFKINYPHIIISNNSEGYESEWDIVNVPDDYVDWYKSNIRQSENAWYAQMNRSYAIKYAKEHGYDYLVQLDDNITLLEIAYQIKKDGFSKRYRRISKNDTMVDDVIDVLVDVLKYTNAGMTGLNLASLSIPNEQVLSERYCYSFFCLDLEKIPDIFHGDFEDDIEFRLKCAQMNVPVIQLPFIRYGKTGQHSGKDETGMRASYTQAGVLRGEHMRHLYGDKYSCGLTSKSNSTSNKAGETGITYFKHKLKPFKVGVTVKNKEAIEQSIASLLKKYAPEVKKEAKIKEKKLHKGTQN